MKNFNEWLSFRSNSYNETESHESDSAFDFSHIPGSVSTNVSRAEDRFKGMIDRYGGASKIRNKRVLLAEIIKDIYDFTDEKQLTKVKTDLRTLLSRLQTSNNLDNVEGGEESEELEGEMK